MRAAKRFLRFSLATVLLAITVIGIWLGSVVRDVHRKERVAAEITRLDGQITTEPVARFPNFRWLREFLGDAYYNDIQRINLTGSKATDATVELLSQLRSVDQLDLAQTKITDEALQHVSRMESLRALTISFNDISNDALPLLARLPELIFLDLDVTRVTDDGLEALKEFPKIYHVKLYGNPITNQGCKILSEIKTIGELDLGNTQITDDGLAYLAELPALQRLRLDQMITGSGEELRITDRGMQHIAKMENLIDLGLVSLAITDDGLRQLRGMPKLRYVDVHNVKAITDAGARHLSGIQVTR
jgi:hypothetical protein